MVVVDIVVQSGEITTGASYSTKCPPLLEGVGVVGRGVDTVGDPGRGMIHASGGGGGLCGGGVVCVGRNNVGENDGVRREFGGEFAGEVWNGVVLGVLLMVVVVTVRW